jgi:hypothetical protein
MSFKSHVTGRVDTVSLVDSMSGQGVDGCCRSWISIERMGLYVPALCSVLIVCSGAWQPLQMEQNYWHTTTCLTHRWHERSVGYLGPHDALTPVELGTTRAKHTCRGSAKEVSKSACH